jgi:hypothetical protein
VGSDKEDTKGEEHAEKIVHHKDPQDTAQRSPNHKGFGVGVWASAKVEQASLPVPYERDVS